MLIMGGLMMKKDGIWTGAQWYGKEATAYTYVIFLPSTDTWGCQAMALRP